MEAFQFAIILLLIRQIIPLYPRLQSSTPIKCSPLYPEWPTACYQSTIWKSFGGGRAPQREINRKFPSAKLRWQAGLWEKRAWPLRLEFEMSPNYAELAPTTRCACTCGSFILLDVTNCGRKSIPDKQSQISMCQRLFCLSLFSFYPSVFDQGLS